MYEHNITKRLMMLLRQTGNRKKRKRSRASYTEQLRRNTAFWPPAPPPSSPLPMMELFLLTKISDSTYVTLKQMTSTHPKPRSSPFTPLASPGYDHSHYHSVSLSSFAKPNTPLAPSLLPHGNRPRLSRQRQTQQRTICHRFSPTKKKEAYIQDTHSPTRVEFRNKNCTQCSYSQNPRYCCTKSKKKKKKLTTTP